MKLFSKDNRVFCALLDLALASELLIFVGAGSSIEAGLPNWQELAWRYINHAMQKEDEWATEGEFSADFIPRGFQKYFNPRHLAVIADAMVGEHHRLESISLELYGDWKQPEPGPTAKEVAKLYRSRYKAGLKTLIVTTNFDPLIEIALNKYVRDVLPDSVGTAEGFALGDCLDGKAALEDVAGLFAMSVTGKHIPRVFHLHGSLDFRTGVDDLSPLILTERDYAQYGYVAQRALTTLLNKRDCLMIGVGLEDNDVLNSLYAQLEGGDEMTIEPPPKGTRYVVAYNEIRYGADDDEDPLARQKAVERMSLLETRRLERLDVTPLEELKNFAQIPQVLHEMSTSLDITQSNERPGTYWTSGFAYGDRLSKWKKDFRDKYFPNASSPEEQAKFECEQAMVSKMLQGELEEIRRLTETTDELAIHIWVRSEADEPFQMFPWCSNEFARRWKTPASLNRPVEHREFDIALRQAFEGVPSRGLREAANHSRWSQILAVPIISRTSSEVRHDYCRLLIGVVTLSTTASRQDSNLSKRFKLKRELVSTVERTLDELGRRLLVEDVWNDASLAMAERAEE